MSRRVNNRFTRGVWITLGAASIWLTLVWLAQMWQPLYPIYAATFEGGTFDLGTRIAAALPAAAVIALPIGIVLGAGWLMERQGQRAGWLAVLLLVMSCASMILLSLVQLTANYRTRYRYTYSYADYDWSVEQARALGANAYLLAIKDTL